MALNDWIVAGLNNPDFTSSDFSTIAGMDLTNTQMLSADEYLKSDFIKNHEMFKNENGTFSEDKFRTYHKKRTLDFQEFQTQEFPKGPQLDMFDTDRTKDSKIKDIHLDVGRHVNPDRLMVGIEGVNVWSAPTMTKSEIAQTLKIWDTETQTFKDYSPNDKSLVNGVFDWVGLLFSDPLVLAKWDEEGTHINPITGLEETHKKGDYILNEKGTYYYETLNGRSPIGQEVLSVFDTLTVDGEGINKYDFFDSDDIEKSITGVIAKNVVQLLPLFTPAAGVYSTVLIAKELALALPMVYGWMTSLSGSNEAPAWLNSVAARGSQFTTGTSLYAKENIVSFENFGNLIADVALQWGQQKTIASAFNKLRGTQSYVDDAMKNAKALYNTKAKTLGHSEALWKQCQDMYLPEAEKLVTKASQLGRDASLAYMAIISNSDLYNDMRAQGLTNREASAISLGSTLGMFAFNKYTNLGEIFFDDATDDAIKMARQSVKSEMNSAKDMFKAIKQSNAPAKNKYLKFMQTAADKAQKALSSFQENLKYHTLSFAEKTIGEGLEEVSEEAIQDVFKGLYELAGEFGANTTLKDIGAWDNALQRYGMSFVGGAIGGGVFYGKEVLIDGKSFKQDIKNQEMATLIRNGYANELRAEIEKLKNAGKLGSTTLSASKYAKNEKGELVYLTTEDVDDSQNHAIAKAMLDKVNALETIIINNKIGLSDDELFDNMVFSELRYKRYEKIAPLTNYYQDFNNIASKLIAAELDLKAAENTVEGTPKGTPKTDFKLTPEQEARRQENLTKLKLEVEILRKQKDDFLSGNNSLEYVRKLNFLMDPALHGEFLTIDKDQYFKEKYGNRAYSQLNPEEMLEFELDWSKKIEIQLKLEVDSSWEAYKEIEALIIPELQTLSDNTPKYKSFLEGIKPLLEESTDENGKYSYDLDTRELRASLLNWNSLLEGESDEDYEYRNKKKSFTEIQTDADGNVTEVLTEESDYDYSLRLYDRAQKIEEYNSQKNQEWVDKINTHLEKVNYEVDPATYSLLMRSLPQRASQIVERKIELANLHPKFKGILHNLKPDLSNIDEVSLLIQDENRRESEKIAESLISKFTSLLLIDIDGTEVDINEFISNAAEEDDYFTLESLLTSDRLDLDNNDEAFDFIQNSLIPLLGKDMDVEDILNLQTGVLNNNTQYEEFIELQSTPHLNSLNTIISTIKNDPIYNFTDKIKKTVKNPIGELIKVLAEKKGDKISNIDELLEIIELDYAGIKDANQLILDDTSRENLIKVRNYFKLIRGFIYAASSKPDSNTPFGHNQVINEFAKKNKDKLTSDWQVLPEIDSDYQTLYNLAISNYITEIDEWIHFSDQNQVNKIRKFVAGDKAFTKAWLEVIKDKNLKFTIDGIEYDLLKGFVEDPKEVEVSLFNAEKILYKNFQEILNTTDLSVTQLFELSGLLEKLIPSINNIASQKISILNESLTKAGITDFDMLLYFAQVFTLNPSEFYSELKSKINNNSAIAPITTQEYASRLAKAIVTPQYREIIKYAHQKSGSQLPILTNSLFIPGVAGAGKTSVVLASVNNPDENVIIAGPTESQGETLQNSLKRSKSYTFQQLLTNLLGKELYLAIQEKFKEVKTPQDARDWSFDCDYFTVKVIKGSPVVKLKKDALKFNTLENIPSKIFLDEATHLSALDALIIDAYAESVNAVVYLAGDTNQRGYSNSQSGIENLLEDIIFCSRAPKLSISLRDNNLQKFQNLELVRSLLDTMNENIINMDAEALKEYWPKAQHIMSKFNFRVYNHEVLNGDLITYDLNSDLIEKLKFIIDEEGNKKEATVGFIGDASSSYITKLKEAGIEPTILNMDSMLGQEFDYVIIDQEWKLPPLNMRFKAFLTDLYTTMTRARTASIFIDNGLSKIIGDNVNSTNLSKAPSIASGIEMLIKEKINTLDKFEFELGTPTKEEKSEAEKPFINPSEDIIDPDNKPIDVELRKKITQIAKTDFIESDSLETRHITEEGEQMLEVFSDITILGAEQSEPLTRVVEYNGETIEITAPIWTIKLPLDKKLPLRNLQALVDTLRGTNTENGFEIIKYGDKEKAQKMLFDIKSAIIYQHGYSDLPQEIRGLISKSNWESGELQIEIRKPDVSDTTHLNAYFDLAGIEHNGLRYIANVVFKVKLNDGRMAIFDIAGLPSLDKYAANLSTIQSNLVTRISKASGDEKTQLQKIYNGSRAALANYTNLLNTWIDQLEKDEFKPITLNQGVVKFNSTTWFQNLDESHKKTGLQLGGWLNPNTGERTKDSLERRHPEMVISPIYTYTGKKEFFENLDPSIKGKAIVFVSSDTLLKKEDLIRIWQEQRKNPKNNTARVRMLVLDNYGLTFSQFIDDNFITKFQHGDEERKPFRQNFTGLRMFTSMWNWRASLYKFNDALNQWSKAHNYTDIDKITKITQAAQEIYDEEKINSTRPTNEKINLNEFKLKILTKYNITEEDLLNLEEFNTKYCENVPIFRLGYSTKNKGWYIQGKVDVKNSSVYEKDYVNLLAVTPQKAQQFLYLLEKIFSSIEPNNLFGFATLGVQLLKEDGSKWNSNELIDIKDAEKLRTVSKLLQLKDKKLVLINKDNHTVAYADGNQWSAIPNLIGNFVRTITYFLHHPEELNSQDNITFAQIKIQKDKSSETKTMLKTLIDDIFDSGNLQLDSKDHSLFDLMDLMFHGTRSDIHSNKENILLLEDAYFKQGFFINPDLSRSSANNADAHIFSIDDEVGDAMFYKIATSPELFTVDTNVRASGLGIRIDLLFKQSQEELIKQEEEIKREESGKTKEEEFKEKYESLSRIIDYGIQLGLEWEYDLAYEKEVENFYNETIQRRLKQTISQNNSQLNADETFNVKIENGQVTTFSIADYIANQLMGKIITSIEFKNGEFIVDCEDGTKYTMNESLELEIDYSGLLNLKNKIDLNTANLQSVNQSTIEQLIETSKYNIVLESGLTVKQSLIESFKDKDLKNEVLNDDLAGSNFSTEDWNNLKKQIINILNSDDTETIQERLSLLENESEICSIFFANLAITDKYKDLYDQLFKCD